MCDKYRRYIQRKEVVQVYYSAPTGKLEKPYQELAAYAKTKELAPGESEELIITYQVDRMASYDVQRASYVLEAGTYYVRVGVNSRATKVSAAVVLDQETVTEVLSNRLVLDCEMNELSSADVTPYGYAEEEAEKEQACKLDIASTDIETKTVTYEETNAEIAANTSEKKITMQDVMSGQATLDDLGWSADHSGDGRIMRRYIQRKYGR